MNDKMFNDKLARMMLSAIILYYFEKGLGPLEIAEKTGMQVDAVRAYIIGTLMEEEA